MTLDEAIKHCEEKAKELREKAKIYEGQFLWERDAEDCQECAEEHEQLAEWLTELKAYREGKSNEKTEKKDIKMVNATPYEKGYYFGSYDVKRRIKKQLRQFVKEYHKDYKSDFNQGFNAALDELDNFNRLHI